MAKSWGKYSPTHRQIHPDDTPAQSLTLHKECDERSVQEVEWRLFECFFKNLNTYNDGAAETDDFVRNIPKEDIFKAESNALVFFNSLGVNITTKSYIYIKQIKSTLESGNDSIHRMSLELVRLVSMQELQGILCQIPNRMITPRCSSTGSSLDLTARTSTSDSGRRGSTGGLYKSNLTPRHLRQRRGRTRDRVLNRMISRAYSTVNESLGNATASSASSKNDDTCLSNKRRNSLSDITGSPPEVGTLSVGTLTFRQRIDVENYLSLRGC